MARQKINTKMKIIPEEMDNRLIEARCENLYLKILKDCNTSNLDITLQIQQILKAYKTKQNEFEKELFDSINSTK